MELIDGDLRPVWLDPCDGVTPLIGCMVMVGDDLAPKLVETSGRCDFDQVGCMEFDGDDLQPVLVLAAYDNVVEFHEDCCHYCPECSGDLEDSRFIELTFSNILWCPGDGGGYDNPNDTFTLEYDDAESSCWNLVAGISNACAWSYHRSGGAHVISCDCIIYTAGGTQYIIIGLTYDSGLRGCPDANHQIFSTSRHSAETFSCLDTNFDNHNIVTDCNPVTTQGYDGEVVVNWAP